MKKRSISWLLLILGGPLFINGADKSKKAYELIYSDIQLVKQQLLELNRKIDQGRKEMDTLKQQVTELLDLAKLGRSEQAVFQSELKNLAVQNQILQEKFKTLNTDVAKISEKLIEIQQATSLPQTQKENAEQPAPEKPIPENQSEEEPEREELSTPIEQESKPSPTLSPQELFNMARTDYLKGNYQLAIEGFSIYRENFPESPLMDDALYWIGECFFSQGKHEEAVSQFNDLILHYPQGNKVPAAYLKKGHSLLELKRENEAISAFKLLIIKFPYEEETKLAQQKIQELGY